MKILSSFLGLVFGLALLAALLAGGYFLFRYVADGFATLEPTVATLTAIASVVALLCATIVANGLKARSKRRVRSTHHLMSSKRRCVPHTI